MCSQERVWSIFAKKRGLNRRSGPPVHDDLVQRQFKAQAANQLWLADITERRTDEGKLYLCAIKDVYSNRIMGYSIDSRMKSTLVVAALNNAVALRSPVATIVHSDKGSRFRSRRFVHALSHNGLHGSMGRVGACGDNAAMESFFAPLQRNVLDQRRWATRAELRLAMVSWIERTYHRRRRQRALGQAVVCGGCGSWSGDLITSSRLGTARVIGSRAPHPRDIRSSGPEAVHEGQPQRSGRWGWSGVSIATQRVWIEATSRDRGGVQGTRYR